MKKINNKLSLNKTISSSRFSGAVRVQSGGLLLAALFGLVLGGCGADTPVANAPDPVKPAAYVVDKVADIGYLEAAYTFEGAGLADASGSAMDAEVVGLIADSTTLGNITFDLNSGIHALSQAAVFDGFSGLRLPGDLLNTTSYTVSMWVKPTKTNVGPYFYVQSPDGNTLTFASNGLTVTGNTGFGVSGTESLTYKGDFKVEGGEWSHIAFTVDNGAVDLYVNGTRVYKAGDLLNSGYKFANNWRMETDGFADLFAGKYNTIALGVTQSMDDIPFEGVIDDVRIYSDALYYGNVKTLAAEVENEGPAVTVESMLADASVTLDWIVDGFTPSYIHVKRFQLGQESAVTLTADAPLSGLTTTYTDAPPGGDFYYWLELSDDAGHTFVTDESDIYHVMGDAPYAAVKAKLVTTTGDIELTLYTENINVGNYRVLRSSGASADFATAIVIAEGQTGATYVDLKADAFPLLDGTTYYYWVEVVDADTLVTTSSFTLPAASATAAGVFVPPGQLTIEEMDDGFCGVSGSGSGDPTGLETTNGGFDGIGYINTENVLGASVFYKVNVAQAGTYSFSYRYAHGGANARDALVKLSDGTVLLDPMAMSPTGAFTTYNEIKNINIELPAGDLDLIVEAKTAEGVANLDWIRFDAVNTGTAPTGIPCL